MPSGGARLSARLGQALAGRRWAPAVAWLRRRAAQADWIAWAVAGLGFALYLTLTLARWHRQDAPSLDLAIFEQAVKGYAHFGPPIVDIKGPGANQLGDHFSPILALLAPFYRVFPSPVTLLVAQCVLVALSIVPVTALARRRLGRWSGLAFGAAYALSWGLQTGVDAQFHEYAFAVPMLAFALAAALDQRWTAAALWAAATVTVKEDMGLTVIAFGAVMAGHGWWLRRREAAARNRDAWWPECRAGLLLIGGGLTAFVLVFGLLMPAFKGGDWYYWGKVDQTGGALGLIVGILEPPVKLKTLALVSAVVMGTCWLSRWSLVALPTLFWRFASTDSAHWGTMWHYSMILMPMVFLAALDVLGRWRASKRRWPRGVARVTVAASLAFAVVATAWFPLGKLTRPDTYAPSPRADQAARVLELIPDGASVASDRGLITQLATDHVVYWIGDYADRVQPDYVLLDPMSGWSNDPGGAEGYAESVYGGDYEPVGGIGPPDDQTAYRLARRLP
jgi:uncharacterized membrane protein